MSTQFSLWLYPLVMFAALALFLRLRLGLAWAWGFVIQVLLIGACGVAGLTIGPDWFFAPLGWLFFVVFSILPKILLSRLDTSVSLLRSKDAVKYAHQLRFFYWGQPGQFWLDMTRANALFLDRRVDDAMVILNSWEGRKIPNPVREVVYTYKLSGHAVLAQWEEIVKEYEEAAAQLDLKVSPRLSLAASRAYLEVGDADQSAFTLERSLLSESRSNSKNTALTLVPYFALLGALSETKNVLQIGSSGQDKLPNYVSTYWMARCYARAGQIGEAKVKLLLCQDEAKDAPQNWKVRIQNQLEKLNFGNSNELTGNVKEAIHRGSAIFSQCLFVEKVLSSRTSSPVVTSLAVLIFAIYIITDMHYLIDSPELRLASHALRVYGVLIPSQVMNGEYWRLFTYLFLHAHVSHAALNILGLYWFGRMTVNIYGPIKFMIIYVAAGILSGVAHVVLAPAQNAVGASGAIMGIFGAAGAGIWLLKDQLPKGIRKQEITWMLCLAISQVVLDQFVPHVAAMAHLGGLIAGFILGLILGVRKPKVELPAY
ncbi:MAG: rhomboid family intramembrane serine protease [Leptolyngbya sp.]|nr:rhomboid family intramembrane serine protease [Candidatus Melainabacteria bacterium]